MIPVRTALRIMPAAWFAVPVAMLAAWYATLLPSPPGYGTAATAAASGAMPFIGAFVAASAAWEGSRLRQAVWGGPWARSEPHIAAGVLVGPVGAGVFAATAAILVAHVGAAALPPDLTIFIVLIIDIVAYAIVGFALGVLAPKALAVPVAAVLPVLWLAFVPAMYPVWLRHLTGMYRDCCSLEYALAPQAVLASVTLDGALIATACVLSLVSWPRLWRTVAAAGILAIGFQIGIAAASDLTYAPVVPRDADLLSCASRGGVDVCVWPEHAAGLPSIVATIADARSRWLAAGIDPPSTFSEASGASGPSTLEMHLRGPLSEDRIILALADGMVRRPDCGHATRGGIAIPYLQAWYAAAGGLSRAALENLDGPGDDLNPSILTVIDQLGEADGPVRREWTARAAAIGQTCDDIVPDLRVGE